MGPGGLQKKKILKFRKLYSSFFFKYFLNVYDQIPEKEEIVPSGEDQEPCGNTKMFCSMLEKTWLCAGPGRRQDGVVTAKDEGAAYDHVTPGGHAQARKVYKLQDLGLILLSCFFQGAQSSKERQGRHTRGSEPSSFLRPPYSGRWYSIFFNLTRPGNSSFTPGLVPRELPIYSDSHHHQAGR